MNPARAVHDAKSTLQHWDTEVHVQEWRAVLYIEAHLAESNTSSWWRRCATKKKLPRLPKLPIPFAQPLQTLSTSKEDAPSAQHKIDTPVGTTRTWNACWIRPRTHLPSKKMSAQAWGQTCLLVTKEPSSICHMLVGMYKEKTKDCVNLLYASRVVSSKPSMARPLALTHPE